ncbi:hypothetical protein TraAM80_03166 [Trypanosoma rangeli]|uniref:C2 domain-containing protein n=1 Tax=Trypanosoma rangeli TaxID=5698 RepID=A0A3R7ML15_TRYRA|nr:uncharacterized protein TraAM80_03166 [Trypanosoma rangeli]RNF07792.1 hypothetical protein TraAM80_03166 [Trypanosoma rangeli]|eukprot:RNF07792.1 hypothetical protein TraAM80_03166 [Trypanosoma rangeli]
MSRAILLHVDVLRGRNYPQTEDDPCACSTRVRIFLFKSDLQEALSDVFTTGLQENSNAPFYNAGVDFELPMGLEKALLVLEVEEVTRQTEPYIMFYGVQQVSFASKGKFEEVVVLTSTNPLEKPEKAAQEAMQAAESAMQCPVLSIRYNVVRQKSVEEVKDVHADVELLTSPTLTGSCCIIPKDSQYVWVNLISDSRWVDAFHHVLVSEWKDRAPLVCNAAAAESSVNGSTKSAAATKPLPRSTPVDDVRSIGDVIMKRWCCLRSHEVLTRLRLCAEAFNNGEKSFNFTRERELSYRLQRKERICLLQELARASLCKMGVSELRDTLDHLWIFFSTGIKHDPAGTRVLTYETRKKIREAGFDCHDRAVLHSSILNLLIPSLTVGQCNDFAAADMNDTAAVENNSAAKPASAIRVDQNNAMSALAAEVAFAMALIEYIGALLDTLTETELLAALKAFEPAVVNAHQRIKADAKEELKRARGRLMTQPQRELKPYVPGEGIKIDHLDVLGRRKKSIHLR